DSLTGEKKYQCGGNNISEQQYFALPTKRAAQPNQILQGNVPVYIYRNVDNTTLFIMNDAANNSMIVKLFFDIENTPDYELVYSNKEVRIFKPTFLN
ncbi:MAG TPA: hypothetical protein VFF13_02945, partial [archaeon]|nr:hypothetical protein [archaeon]